MGLDPPGLVFLQSDTSLGKSLALSLSMCVYTEKR